MDKISQIDKEGMRNIFLDYHNHYKAAMQLKCNFQIKRSIQNIFILGMGGSAFPGDLLKCALPQMHLPIFVNKDYDIPDYLTNRSLVFVISYSGNTEETLEAYQKAMARSVENIVVIAAGGKLEEMAKENGHFFVKVPLGLQPRFSVPYLFLSILRVLQNNGLVQGIEKVVDEVVSEISDDKYEKLGKEISKHLVGKIPLIYSSEKNFCLAERWKINMNENAKTMAFYNLFPEFNHNEINGYINKTAEYHAILVRDPEDHERVRKRFDILNKLIRSRSVGVTEVELSGSSRLCRMLKTLYLGAWVSFYLAIEYETDPTPVDIVEELKVELNK